MNPSKSDQINKGVKMQYPEVEQLANAVKRLGLTFAIGEPSESLEKLFYRRIKMAVGGEIFSVPVMDEFEDVPDCKPVVMLQLVLQECEIFEEAADFSHWAEDVGLNGAEPAAVEIYSEISGLVPELRRIFGEDLRAIPVFEIEFNTGMAQYLRDYKL